MSNETEWVMVPKEPTPEMLEKGGVWNTEMDTPPEYEVLHCIWRDMLAAAPQPPAEAQPASYDRKRIAWELERTAMGDGHYGGALRAAKDFPEATPSVRALLDRWATGKEGGLSDRADLCAFALQIYAADGESPSTPAEAQRCTCPSGDGSLRWPCPAHPPEAVTLPEPNWCPTCGRRPHDPVAALCPGTHHRKASPPFAPVGAEDLIRRIDAAIERVTSGRCTMRVPADPTDPDLVLADAGNWIQRHAPAQQPAAVALSREELDTCRQWFDSVQDTNGGYLSPPDYVLATKLYRALGMRVPQSISRIAALLRDHKQETKK